MQWWHHCCMKSTFLSPYNIYIYIYFIMMKLVIKPKWYMWHNTPMVHIKSIWWTAWLPHDHETRQTKGPVDRIINHTWLLWMNKTISLDHAQSSHWSHGSAIPEAEYSANCSPGRIACASSPATGLYHVWLIWLFCRILWTFDDIASMMGIYKVPWCYQKNLKPHMQMNHHVIEIMWLLGGHGVAQDFPKPLAVGYPVPGMMFFFLGKLDFITCWLVVSPHLLIYMIY